MENKVISLLSAEIYNTYSRIKYTSFSGLKTFPEIDRIIHLS